MSQRKKFDVAVIGAGPGGYTAAIRAAQLGKTVALIEKKDVGGTCLNVGCIPSKTLLSNAAVLKQVQKAKEFGISTGPVSFDYAKWKERKDQVVLKIRRNLEHLLKANQISIIQGTASFERPFELKVQGEESLFIEADKIIIATGSIPFDVPAFPCNGKKIINSTSLLDITTPPRSLCIIGGGYIGCEFASLFAAIGTNVTIFEALPSILSVQGKEISQFMTRSFAQQGIQIQANAKVKTVQEIEDHVSVVLENGNSFTFDLALVAVGRKVSTEGLMLHKAGLAPTEKGFLKVNARMETEVRGIYAIGDVTGDWMLAHVASHQGVTAGSNAAGQEESLHYEAVPAVIFTSPEIGLVGMNADQAKEKGYQPVVGSFPFQALGKAQAALDTEGFAQIISDAKTGQILGACVVGHEASNLIAEMALAIQHELTVESIRETIHAHPTLAESWMEAAFIAENRPIHFPPKGKKS